MMQGASAGYGGGLSFEPTTNFLGKGRNVPDIGSGGAFWKMGQKNAEGAINAYSEMRPNSKSESKTSQQKTIGGGISQTVGMGLAGYAIGGAIGGASAGPWGAAIGAGVGLVSYLLS